jgi:hypothetical protein
LDQGLHGAQARIRVLILGLSVILVFFTAVGLVLYFKPGGNSPAPEEASILVAGPLDDFAPGTASYFKLDHVYIVRMTGGALLALYDLGPNIQTQVKQGDHDALSCRIQFVDDENGVARSGDPPPGFEDKVFMEDCQGNVWDAAGHYLAGPSEVDLDRFPLSVVDEVVHVDVSNRRCMNEVGINAPCIPTQ